MYKTEYFCPTTIGKTRNHVVVLYTRKWNSLKAVLTRHSFDYDIPGDVQESDGEVADEGDRHLLIRDCVGHVTGCYQDRYSA
jgi:hypothetical protein